MSNIIIAVINKPRYHASAAHHLNKTAAQINIVHWTNNGSLVERISLLVNGELMVDQPYCKVH